MTATRQYAHERGFTLVEMLVALVIFALLAAAGVGLLRSSVDTQNAVERRLFEMGSIGRVQALLASDLGQAVDRPTRSGNGVRPAFVGQAGRLEFVRAGWTNLDGAPRSDLQRVVWQATGGVLARSGSRMLDGADDGPPAAIARASETRFRFRMANGDWSDSFQPAPDQPLPAAVECTVTPPGAPPVTIVVALPNSGAPPLQQAPA